MAPHRDWPELLIRIDTSKLASVLKPYGPTPIVVTVVGVVALGALIARADSWAVLAVVILVLAAHIWMLERKAALRRKELEVDFDTKQRLEGERLLGPLRLRLSQKREARQEPSMGRKMADFGTISILVGVAKPAVTLILGASMGVAVSLGIDRHRKLLKDEMRLRMAARYLERHLHALAILDSDDTPVEFLDLAIRFSDLIKDPETRSTIAFVLARNPKAYENERREAVSAKWDTEVEKAVRAKRPDLWEALVLANIAGMQAFVLRWPECSPAFDDILADFAASPVREAEIVIRETKRAMTYRHSPKVAFAG